MFAFQVGLPLDEALSRKLFGSVPCLALAEIPL
jgi:hypothetical protein